MIPRVLIVTPARASDNNGNYHTGARWAELLAPQFDTSLAEKFDGQDADVLIALHARRSAGSIAAFRAQHPRAAVLLVFSGTDLYKDIPAGNPEALQSVRLADAWVTLQDHVPVFLSQLEVPLLPEGETRDIYVVYQSALPLRHSKKPAGKLNVAFVGHLRDEKDPATLFHAVRSLPRELPIAVNMIGSAMDAQLANAALVLQKDEGRFAWLGAHAHEKTRELIRQAHVLVVPSKMEGGANVIAEAITAGTPVLASRVSGNIGMLGEDYPGYFEVGDAAALSALMQRCLAEPAFLRSLEEACARREPLFATARESQSLLNAVYGVLRAKR
jgi:putative glycosyltransferase (TIGR04348 family)